MRKLLNLTKIVLVIFNFAIISCQQDNSMKRFKYNTGSSCPSYYGITTYEQVMYSDSDEMIMIDGVGSLRSPWGDGGVTFIKNSPSENPVPKTLNIGYYSDTEDQFYEGEFQLPSEEIEKFLEEKSKNVGVKSQNINEHKYDRIEIGVALGGMIVVWMKGEGEQKEVGKYNAKVVKRNWEDIFDNGTREEEVKYNLEKVFTNKVKEEVLNKTLPIDLWEKYREKFSWNYSVNVPQNAVVNSVYLKMINAEAETNYLKISTDQPSQRAVPYQAEIIWTLNGKRYESRIIFAEGENYYNTIYKATIASSDKPYPADLTKEEIYQNFKKIKPGLPAELIFNLSTNREINVNLKQENTSINIRKITAKTFQH